MLSRVNDRLFHSTMVFVKAYSDQISRLLENRTSLIEQCPGLISGVQNEKYGFIKRKLRTRSQSESVGNAGLGKSELPLDTRVFDTWRERKSLYSRKPWKRDACRP